MYEHKEVYVLDFRNVKYYREVHDIIKNELDFPDYYGCNWDAFWDCMKDMIVSDPVHIQIVGLEVLQKKDYDDEIGIFLATLKDCKHYRNDKYADSILIEVIDENGNVTVVE